MTVTTQLPSTSFPVYPYVQPGVPDTVALGKQSLLEYNGLVLNDRQRPDRYLVTSLEGLGGADLRDSRALRPANHGEIPYDSYWGGRTITIEGQMEAGSLYEMTRMERDLRAAFSTLIEAPMKFNWWDVHDDFSDAYTSNAWWQTLSGERPTIIGNGIGSFHQGISYYAKREYIDNRTIVGLKMISTSSKRKKGIISHCTSNTSYVAFTINYENERLEAALSMNIGEGFSFTTNWENVKKQEVSNNIPMISDVWLELRCIDGKYEGIVWSADPTIEGNNAQELMHPIVLNPTGIFAEIFGYGQSGYSGIISETSAGVDNWVVDDFIVQSIWPGDLVADVRSISIPILKNTVQTSTNRFKQEFQISVRASNPRYVNPVWMSLGPVTNGVSLVAQFTVMNHGTWIALPVCNFQNAGAENIQNPRLNNLTTGDFIEFSGNFINLGPNEQEFPTSKQGMIIVDSSRRTIVNRVGSNFFNLFSPESNFPALAPGPNVFSLSTTKGTTLRCWMKWQHTYD